MSEYIILFGLGLLVTILGIINMSGNLSTIHWYHRKRVSEENRTPFGKLVGLGTLIIGLALIVYGILLAIYNATHWEALTVIGAAVLIISMLVGLAISFYAMKKYNGGIF